MKKVAGTSPEGKAQSLSDMSMRNSLTDEEGDANRSKRRLFKSDGESDENSVNFSREGDLNRSANSNMNTIKIIDKFEFGGDETSNPVLSLPNEVYSGKNKGKQNRYLNLSDDDPIQADTDSPLEPPKGLNDNKKSPQLLKLPEDNGNNGQLWSGEEVLSSHYNPYLLTRLLL